jgi:hypothetical protein
MRILLLVELCRNPSILWLLDGTYGRNMAIFLKDLKSNEFSFKFLKKKPFEDVGGTPFRFLLN